MCTQCLMDRPRNGRDVRELKLTRHFLERCRQRGISSCDAVSVVVHGGAIARPGTAVAYRLPARDGEWREHTGIAAYGIVVIARDNALLTVYRREVLSEDCAQQVLARAAK